MTERGEQAEIGRSQDTAGAERDGTAGDVFTGQAPVVAGTHDTRRDAHAVAVELDEFLRHDGVEAGRHHRSGHDANALPCPDRAFESFAGEAGPGQLEQALRIGGKVAAAVSYTHLRAH